MIRDLASRSNVERAHALKDDVRVAVSVHEAGHVLMGRRHGVRFSVLLPTIMTKGGITEVAEHAGGEISRSNVNPSSVVDLVFGGYCGELVFYDEQFLQSGAAIFVHADRAANDLLGFITLSGAKVVDASLFELALRKGGEAASHAVRMLFQQYGMTTYRAMRLHRDGLIGIAQELFEFWQDHRFQKCTWQGV